MRRSKGGNFLAKTIIFLMLVVLFTKALLPFAIVVAIGFSLYLVLKI